MAPKGQKDNSVWTAMSYQPPRGKCNYKTSIMSPACACLRFMLHPVKAATSFECDGCNHHASFHSLENPSEDAILRKWAAEETQQQVINASQNKKRKLLTQHPGTVVELESDGEVASMSSRTTRQSGIEEEEVVLPPRRGGR